MTFINRTDAGEQLAEKVEAYLSENKIDKKDILVVGLPKGGVVVALEVARKLSCPVDVLVSKKLPYPNKPELAIGAVSSDGLTVLNNDLPKNRPWQHYIEGQEEELLYLSKTIENKLYKLTERSKPSYKGKTVIVVDDGIATGITAVSALKTAKQRGAKSVFLAVPIMSLANRDFLSENCDALINISAPEYLVSVSRYYLDFRPIPEEFVLEAMKESIGFVA
ncbi:MAG: hypothetical protein KIT34_10065 [Cyanobacteria bacterium TGS_CYA1]|nr:hypothetical protein [Cyanobacteria bacterium TGS_CYA1]